LGPHSQGVALGYLIPPRWGLKLILLLPILLKILFLQAMLSPLGLKTDFVIAHSSKDSFSTSNAFPVGA
jgi:hypothetical protein